MGDHNPAAGQSDVTVHSSRRSQHQVTQQTHHEAPREQSPVLLGPLSGMAEQMLKV